MSAVQRLLNFFEENHGILTLGQILNSGTFAASYRRMITELRHKGYIVRLEQDRKAPSNNKYYLIAPRKFEGPQSVFW